MVLLYMHIKLLITVTSENQLALMFSVDSILSVQLKPACVAGGVSRECCCFLAAKPQKVWIEAIKSQTPQT